MAFQFFSLAGCTAIVVVAATFVMRWLKSAKPSLKVQSTNDLAAKHGLHQSVTKVIETFKSILPPDVLLLDDDAFYQSTRGHWAEQECEERPACVVQPRNGKQLCRAIEVLSDAHDERGKSGDAGGTPSFFAVRGGGHSAASGAASVKAGVLIDLSRLNKIELSADRKSVAVGAGARWMDVSSFLDREGLAAVGGRNSHVGVGGLTLGGGISWFSPQFGFVCSNVIEYEVVLASGSLVTASASTNADLWRALKGGSNNFGVVTRFRFHCFPSGDVWAGFLYIPSFQSDKVLSAFHQSVVRADPDRPTFDQHAAGPIACFTYLQDIGIQVVSVNLAYTKPCASKARCPEYWAATPFPSIWRFWSTCKNRSLTDATDELRALNPAGRRQAHATTTVKNDVETIRAAHEAYRSAIKSIRCVRGISWTLVMQPLVPEWARKGDTNPLGLDQGASEPLVLVSFTVNWGDAKDDELVSSETRRVVEELEAFARARGTAHPYRYLNYCDRWQDPFKGYGEENLELLRKVSRRYDSNGLFQRGCSGGFKLWRR